MDTKAKKEILEAINKAKLSILRGIHSKDKTAKLLINLVEKVRDNEDTYVWKCPECGADAAWDVSNAADAGTPMCGECDVDMKPDFFLLFDSEEWKEADAYVLRINEIRDSKKNKKKEDN